MIPIKEARKMVRLSPWGDGARKFIITAAAVAFFFVSAGLLDLDVGKFFSRLGNTGNVVRKLLVLNPAKLPEAAAAMLSSICIALASLFAGFIISIVLAFLAAKNIAPHPFLGACIKAAAAVIRAIPALVWILMIAASMGFGATGGMVGLVFPTVGYLTKSFISSIEEMGSNVIEAMRSTGASWPAIVSKGMIPGLTAPFLSWIALRIEGNIAESVNLGMLGIAGVGNLLMTSLGKYDYSSISTIIMVILAALVLTEIMINKIKKIIKNAR
jgi:phosphonate transport system permease protein